MAQHERDREDLLREATALTVRAELAVDGFDEHVVIGFRHGGAASVFFGADPVYQFNSANQLRRGFRHGQLIKAVDGRLFSMRRQRAGGQVQFLRSEMDATTMADYLKTCREQLSTLTARLAEMQFQVIGQVPEDGDVLAQITDWLQTLPEQLAVATKPNVA